MKPAKTLPPTPDERFVVEAGVYVEAGVFVEAELDDLVVEEDEDEEDEEDEDGDFYALLSITSLSSSTGGLQRVQGRNPLATASERVSS